MRWIRRLWPFVSRRRYDELLRITHGLAVRLRDFTAPELVVSDIEVVDGAIVVTREPLSVLIDRELQLGVFGNVPIQERPRAVSDDRPSAMPLADGVVIVHPED